MITRILRLTPLLILVASAGIASSAMAQDMSPVPRFYYQEFTSAKEFTLRALGELRSADVVYDDYLDEYTLQLSASDALINIACKNQDEAWQTKALIESGKYSIYARSSQSFISIYHTNPYDTTLRIRGTGKLVKLQHVLHPPAHVRSEEIYSEIVSVSGGVAKVK